MTFQLYVEQIGKLQMCERISHISSAQKVEGKGVVQPSHDSYSSNVDYDVGSRDAAGHYPTRATRPVTRPVLNRPNYPYYP